MFVKGLLSAVGKMWKLIEFVEYMSGFETENTEQEFEQIYTN